MNIVGYWCTLTVVHPTRLEEEGAQNQKLLSEKATMENKIKGLEEQMTLSEDSVSKVTHTHTQHSHTHSHTSTPSQLSRDKKTLEEKLQETQAHLEAEENKAKQEHRQRLKLESNLQDVEEKLDRETNVSGCDNGMACV